MKSTASYYPSKTAAQSRQIGFAGSYKGDYVFKKGTGEGTIATIGKKRDVHC